VNASPVPPSKEVKFQEGLEAIRSITDDAARLTALRFALANVHNFHHEASEEKSLVIANFRLYECGYIERLA
jgi:hypothetical protein